MPDTSPRDKDTDGIAVPNIDRYDLGIGASFYINADQYIYTKHYQMYTYITDELPALLEGHFGIGKDGLRSISGHSMGGHGALMTSLNNPSGWVSVSAFAPICNRECFYLYERGSICFVKLTLPIPSSISVVVRCPPVLVIIVIVVVVIVYQTSHCMPMGPKCFSNLPRQCRGRQGLRCDGVAPCIAQTQQI